LAVAPQIFAEVQPCGWIKRENNMRGAEGFDRRSDVVLGGGKSAEELSGAEFTGSEYRQTTCADTGPLDVAKS